MRYLILMATLGVAACASPVEQARRICRESGLQAGSLAFQSCFDNTLRTIAMSRAMANAGPSVCTTSGPHTICN